MENPSVDEYTSTAKDEHLSEETWKLLPTLRHGRSSTCQVVNDELWVFSYRSNEAQVLPLTDPLPSSWRSVNIKGIKRDPTSAISNGTMYVIARGQQDQPVLYVVDNKNNPGSYMLSDEDASNEELVIGQNGVTGSLQNGTRLFQCAGIEWSSKRRTPHCFELYNSSDGYIKWEKKNEMPYKVVAGCYASDGNRIIVAGGNTGEYRGIVSSVLALEGVNEDWKFVETNLTYPIEQSAGAMVGNLMICIGGKADKVGGLQQFMDSVY